MNSASYKSMPQLQLPTGWQIVEPHLLDDYPEAPWSWILEQGSLTRCLQTNCPESFNLKLLGEVEVIMPDAEALLLDVACGCQARSREVYLACGEIPCIYAYSLIPLTTLHGGGSYLDGLGARPLGDALFTDPSLQRGPIEVIMLKPETGYFTKALRDSASSNEPIWGRRSVFRTGGSALLVCEFFLPGLYACVDQAR
jgi:chorismate--pyruvate lyase